MSDQSKWATQYKETLENPPEIGAILTAFDDVAAKLTAELKEGAPPFIFARAYVPDLLGVALGWHIRAIDDKSYHGWRCVLLARARADVIKKIGLGELNGDGTEGTLKIKSLRVIRYSNSGNSILCEVHEYWPEEEELQMAVPAEEGDEEAARALEEAAVVPEVNVHQHEGAVAKACQGQ